MFEKRTDLAMEAREIWQEGKERAQEIPGVKSEEYDREGFHITKVTILDENGERELKKPKGTYVTVDLSGFLKKEEDAFGRAIRALAEEIKGMASQYQTGSALIAGLGNRNITPDAIGPETIDNVVVTRHLVSQLPDQFGKLKQVAALSPGVLGITGMETGEIIKGVVEKVGPTVIVVIDALASRRISRLCTTIQIADTGIVPGSGVGNVRFAINRDTLGVPVIALGVPTVVDAATLAADVAENAGVTGFDFEQLTKGGGDLIVTPKDIDRNISDIAKVIGYGINLAMNESMTVEDVDLFLS